MLLFKDLMESVLWWKKGEMKKTVHRAIIPLLFRMSDETESVAEVQISDLATDVGTGCADTRGVFWAWGGQGSSQLDACNMCLWCHLPASASPQVSAEALLACAKFLKWKQLEQLARNEDVSKIREYLVRRTSQPQAPYGQAFPTCPGCGLCSCAWPALLRPKVPRLQLHRGSVPSSTEPQGLFCRPLCLPHPQDAGGDPSPSGPWQRDRRVS